MPPWSPASFLLRDLRQGKKVLGAYARPSTQAAATEGNGVGGPDGATGGFAVAGGPQLAAVGLVNISVSLLVLAV